jgi:hypothetical protein
MTRRRLDAHRETIREATETRDSCCVVGVGGTCTSPQQPASADPGTGSGALPREPATHTRTAQLVQPDPLSHPPRTVRAMIPRHSRCAPRAYEPERIVGLWWCPVCGGAAHRYARPGRPRVYCSNACRQRAYRSRRDTSRDHGVSTSPLRRATSRERSHAVREPDALVGGRRDTSGRAVTLCGTFARPAHPRRRGHVRFVSDVPWSCRSCTHLGGLNPTPP